MRNMQTIQIKQGMPMPMKNRLHVNLLKMEYANAADINAQRNPHTMQIHVSKKIKSKIVMQSGKDLYIFLAATPFERMAMQLQIKMAPIWIVL